jgi:hypothetical protein
MSQPKDNLMNRNDIAQQRLANQQMSTTQFDDPAELVRWMGAVQSQDFAAAKWALGLRLPGSSDTDIEQAFTDGRILRTHVMRPTWHFVTPADIRWMLELTAPRVNALSAYYYRKMELDEAIFQRCKAIMVKALEGGNQLTREELATLFEQVGVKTNDLRAAYIVGWAELDATICSGARRGKHFTYALLDERAPQAKSLPREEAVIELMRRYFVSHGPATLQDFVWWSGLLVTDAKAALETVKSQLECEVIDGQAYWFVPAATDKAPQSSVGYLLPNYDEYSVGYSDRSAIYDGEPPNHLDPRGVVLLNYIIVVDSQVVGAWRRTFKKGRVIIELKPFAPLSAIQNEAILKAAQRYGAFLELAVEMAIGY